MPDPSLPEQPLPAPAFKSRRERYVAESAGKVWGRIPRYLYWLVPTCLLIIMLVAFRGELSEWWRRQFPRSLVLALQPGAGQQLPSEARLLVLPIDTTLYQASPLPAQGELRFDAEGRLSLLEGQLPEVFLGVVDAEGFGRAVHALRMDYRDEPLSLELSPARVIEGRITDEDRRPIAAARVLALSDRRGVLLDEARSDARGRYRLTRVAEQVQSVTMRVLAPGYAIDEWEFWPNAMDVSKTTLTTAYEREANRSDARLQKTAPIQGRVGLMPGIDPAGLQISVLKAPGLRSRVGGEGSFEISQPRPGMRYRLLVQGLPEGVTHEPLEAEAGDRDLHIQLVAARHIHGRLEVGPDYVVHSAQVSHGYGPRGGEWCEVGEDGRFQLSGCARSAARVRVAVENRAGRTQVRDFDVPVSTHPGITPLVLSFR